MRARLSILLVLLLGIGPLGSGLLGSAPVAGQDVPDPHAGVPGFDPHGGADGDPHGGDPHADVPGADPHAGVPGMGGADPHAGVPGMGGADPHGADPHAGVPGMDPHGGPAADPGAAPDDAAHSGMNLESMFRPPDVARAMSSADIPAGTVRVEVQDELGAPVNAAEVELGTMAGGVARERQRSSTGPDGVTTYSDLASGSGNAYRVYVNYEGARYASDPFVLMPEQGHRVEIRRLPVTHDDRQLLQFVAQTIVEIREDRLHCVYQAQLVNVGRDTYVFPEGGARMHLPEGFIAFNAPRAMNEIEITEVADHGVAFNGSLPPGLVTIAFSFDVPFSAGLGLDAIGIGGGNDVTMSLGNPFRTMRYRLIVDAPEGLVLDAEDMPRAQRFESDGHTLLGTELMRRPGDPPLEEVVFTLRGLPGPGPTRWFALLGGLGLLGAGVYFSTRDRDGGEARRTMLLALSRREQELIEEAAALRAERDAGEIGPETCQSRLDAIVQELASVLLRREKLEKLGTSMAGVASRSMPGSGPVLGPVSGSGMPDAIAEPPRKNRKKARKAPVEKPETPNLKGAPSEGDA